jgi:hypothetical protein
MNDPTAKQLAARRKFAQVAKNKTDKVAQRTAAPVWFKKKSKSKGK